MNIPYNSATTLTGPYIVPALAMDVAAIHTDKAPVSSVRGAGYPQAAFAIKRMMDGLARALKLAAPNCAAAISSRRENALPQAAQSALREQVQYDSGDYPGCQAEILSAAGRDDLPRRQAQARAEGRYIGIGLAHGIKGTGRGPFEFGNVRISPTSRVTVSTGAAPMGQGLATAWRRFAPRRSACARRTSA